MTCPGNSSYEPRVTHDLELLHVVLLLLFATSPSSVDSPSFLKLSHLCRLLELSSLRLLLGVLPIPARLSCAPANAACTVRTVQSMSSDCFGTSPDLLSFSFGIDFGVRSNSATSHLQTHYRKVSPGSPFVSLRRRPHALFLFVFGFQLPLQVKVELALTLDALLFHISDHALMHSLLKSAICTKDHNLNK